MKSLFYILNSAVFLTMLLLLGCAPVSNNANSNENVSNPNSSNISLLASNNDQVDCKLPGQLRKLGRSMTYLTQGSIVKIPQSECKIRGGVYTIDNDFVSVK